MKRILVAFLFAIPLLTYGASSIKPVDFDLQAITIAEVIQLIYGEALEVPYVIDPAVLADVRPISLRFKSEQGDLQNFIAEFLSSLDYKIETRAGTDFIGKRTNELPTPRSQIFLYRPKYRDVHYLSNLLAPIFKGSFAVNRGVRNTNTIQPKQITPDHSAAALIDQDADVLLFSGEPLEIEQLKAVLPQVDNATGEVIVRGLVYEVSHGENTGSAFGLLAAALGGKVSLGLGSATHLGNYIQVKNTAFEAIYSSLANDSRFKVISSPTLRIQSGAHGNFSVGQEVPVLGALSFPQGAGQAVQSVEYRSSGVIFDIRPVVRDAVIDLDINQQLSNFISTTTGVNNSPTLTKRELKTSVGLQDGDIIVLGGLTENKDGDTRDGLSFLPRFLDTKGQEHSSTEIFLILQVTKL